jgi:hypothetical protein
MSAREFIKKFYNSNFFFKIRELINTFKYKLFIKKNTQLKKNFVGIKENITLILKMKRILHTPNIFRIILGVI